MILLDRCSFGPPTSADTQDGLHQLRNYVASLSFRYPALEKHLETAATSKYLQRVRVDHHVHQRSYFCQTILERQLSTAASAANGSPKAA